ncbi:MAG: acetylxylan esterase [Lentisphaeria bacterium]|nr:acetylxylan esterase [Lentisphaeria bacterium]
MMQDLQRNIWNLQEIARIPEVYNAYGFEEDGLTAIFYENMPWQGKETRAFAWYGFPENATPENPVPGIVLVHGGGGTALADWCRHWIKLGYAVIAMDNCGGVPAWNTSPHYRMKWPRHEFSGPAGWGNLDQAMEPPHEQWMYHAVCSVLRAKELLKSFPQVQKDNIGINGISWGAVLSCVACGLDHSFRFAIPVYGCGGFKTPESFIWDSKIPPALTERWFELWDPDHYLPESTVPFLFLAGTCDAAFPLGAWFESTKLPKGKVYRSLRPDYRHDHSISWQSKTLIDFAKSCSENMELPSFFNIERDEKMLTAEISLSGRMIVSAEIYFTRASGVWMDRKWNSAKAEIQGNRITAEIPEMTTVCYLGFTDDRGAFLTSEPVFCQ